MTEGSATDPLGATSEDASASVPSYAGVLRRLFPWYSSFAAGSLRELYTVTFKPSENHLPQGQRFGENIFSFIVNSLLVELGVADDIDCLQILRDRAVKVVFCDAISLKNFFSGFFLYASYQGN